MIKDNQLANFMGLEGDVNFVPFQTGMDQDNQDTSMHTNGRMVHNPKNIGDSVGTIPIMFVDNGKEVALDQSDETLAIASDALWSCGS